ncbi:MAG: hypothetical protein EA424_27660 [Planctomycetaceae bacterium]|nr:MAG: hypothetical protein EA424_27660 [Planctomycetaceae bacterium]
MAVLGRLPQQQRERVIRELPLEDSDRAKLVDLAQAIGEREDTNSWAAALSTMYPDSTGGDQQEASQPASDQQAETVDDEPLSHLELEFAFPAGILDPSGQPASGFVDAG